MIKTPYRKRIYDTYISKRMYDQRSFCEEAYQKWTKAAMLRFIDWLPIDLEAAILDLGCGHGNFLYLCKQKGYKDLTGVDVGAEQLMLAAKHCKNANLIQSDISGFFSKNQKQFDVISCLNVIEHLHKDELFGFLEKIRVFLKHGGRVIIETPNAECPWMGAVGFGDLTHECFFTPRSLCDVLYQAGFTNFKARPSAPRLGGIKNLKGLFRVFTWQCINFALKIWNLAETGTQGSGIYTRVFIATAVKEKSY